MIIISHRGNVSGLGTINLAVCKRRPWGVELDLRWQGSTPYFDHVPRGHSDVTDAKNILRYLDGKKLAINIKEVGNEAATVDLLKPYPEIFVFDMDLLGLGPTIYNGLPRAIRISDRIDEKDPYKFHAGVIWLDEFKPWVNELDVHDLSSEKKVYWVSPELHNPVKTPQEFTKMETRWKEMIAWGVDGICTDYPQMLLDRLAE